MHRLPVPFIHESLRRKRNVDYWRCEKRKEWIRQNAKVVVQWHLSGVKANLTSPRWHCVVKSS
jgi:hypothetical protein